MARERKPAGTVDVVIVTGMEQVEGVRKNARVIRNAVLRKEEAHIPFFFARVIQG